MDKDKEQCSYSNGIMTDKKFIEEVFEIACGDGARCVKWATGQPREFTKEEVLERLMEFSDNALKWEEGE